MFQRSVLNAIAAGVDLIFQMLSIVQYLGLITDSPGANAVGDALVSNLHWLYAFLRGTLAFIHGMGWVGEAVAQGTFVSLRATAGGIFSAVLQVFWMMVGPVLNNAISGVGHGVQSIGFAILGQYDFEMGEDVSAWCESNKSVCPSINDPKYAK